MTPVQFLSRFLGVGAQAGRVHLSARGPQALLPCVSKGTAVSCSLQHRAVLGAWRAGTAPSSARVENLGKPSGMAALCLKPGWVGEQLFRLQLD